MSPVSPVQAAEIALAHYGVGAAAERLASEHDDTFRLAGADGVARLLKISVAPPATDSPGPPLPFARLQADQFLEALSAVLATL